MTEQQHMPSAVKFSFANKVKDYYQLIKFTLSFTVVFSCVICYLLAPKIVSYNLGMILILFLAGMLVTGSANAINQAVEKETDAQMKRTGDRPVAAGRMSQTEAYIFAFFAGLIGCLMMWYFFNLSSALLSLFSLFLYAFIYTPLKKINSIAVLIWQGGFTSKEISNVFSLTNDISILTVNHDLCGFWSGVVIRCHHKSIGARR